MLAISPQYFPYGWAMNDEENLSYFCRERSETSGGNSNDLQSPSLKNGGDDGDGDKKMKKLNHNASERDRRKKMNTLYANLRSLLPHQDHSLSIPATISRVLKYIPELQREVERLSERKERFISSSSLEFKKRRPNYNSAAAASATRITDAEVVIQTSMPKSDKCSLSEAILRLEEQGCVVVNASCFSSFQGRLFYNLHFQAQHGQVIDAQELKEKVWPLM
ncbi:hypothetical protein SASPL_109061 [Salvia splendens]|uniref:BHLH domain-containing protein n=1 Tax=Salvia splendens TaxID=180675 RepID=A0A8X8YE72_SALSN|nr:transcription factor bHLH100-like [Salvia splendens]KAG6430986.1 hypothetical protein SASPL_109061 [Salvia splendens]